MRPISIYLLLLLIVHQIRQEIRATISIEANHDGVDAESLFPLFFFFFCLI